MSDERDEPTDQQEPAPEPQQPRNLVKVEADERGVLAIMPRDLDEAVRYTRSIIAAGIVPSAFKDGSVINASLVLMGVLKSMEVGLPPLTGLGSLLPLNGRFAIWGDGATALVQSKGLIKNQTKVRVGPAFDPRAELGDWPDDYGWAVTYWRVGQDEPYSSTYTVGDAKRAKLWMNPKKEPWIFHPDRMLFCRPRAFVLRDGFADALMGLAIAEEVRDMTPDVDGGDLKGGSRHLSALDDDVEPVTGEVIEPAQAEKPADPPADLLNENF
jgi:hypothetical protein